MDRRGDRDRGHDRAYLQSSMTSEDDGKMLSKLTADRLRHLLDYDPDTGVWTHRLSRGGKAAGSKAGGLRDGYLVIGIDDQTYQAHRLAWLYMTGEFPIGLLDHRDTDRGNCKWDNLRICTTSQNMANARKKKNNSSGYKGVAWCKQRSKWQATIMKNRKLKFLGYFDNPEDASAAYLNGAIEAFGQFARSE